MAAGFDFKERLGAGYFGEVWLVKDLALNTIKALKLIQPSKVPNPQNFFHEAQILKKVEHDNIVKVDEAGEMDDGKVYLSMEFVKKGSLEDQAKGSYIPLTRAQRIMVDVLRGLDHAHKLKVLHRDIKPGNILVGSNDEGKLSDFGLAAPIGEDLDKLGLKGYVYQAHLAPEVNSFSDYSAQTDIYAAGVTFYRLVNGDSLLSSGEAIIMQQLARQGKFPDRKGYRDFVPVPLKRIINKAISVHPSDRYQTAEEMRRAIESLTLVMNWSERTLQNDGKRWFCSWNNMCYEVKKVKIAKGLWNVTVLKGRGKGSLRRISKYCLDGVKKTVADKHTRNILQDFVLGKIK